jgi:hypothetical protein
MKMLRAFSILVLFVALAAIHLAIYTSSIRASYDIGGIKDKLKAVRSENRYLNYLAAKEGALAKIDSVAKGKLKMVYPEKMNYVTITTKESD